MGKRGDIGRGECRSHCSRRIMRCVDEFRSRHEDEDEDRSQNEGRRQCRNGPAARPCHAVENIAERDHRDDEKRNADRNEIIGGDIVAEHGQEGKAQCANQRCRQKCNKAGCHVQPAQYRGFAACKMLMVEADDRGVEAEAGEIAGQDHDHPDEGVETVFELPHQPCESDLGEKGDCCRGDADGESRQSLTLGLRRFAVVRQYDPDFCDQRYDPGAQARRKQFFRCFDNRHEGQGILVPPHKY
ncbi:hypothetical protein D3C73_768800 [compost metagenome]